LEFEDMDVSNASPDLETDGAPSEDTETEAAEAGKQKEQREPSAAASADAIKRHIAGSPITPKGSGHPRSGFEAPRPDAGPS
jgi:hypothetical protein